MFKKKSKSHKLSVYSNLSHSRKTKKEAANRKHAQYLASLPKHPIKRFFYRLKPSHMRQYWFSRRGLFMALKIIGVGMLLVLLLIGGLFAYFRKDLDSIRPGELAKRVQSTVSTYLDRNGNILWEDAGTGSYQLVVDSDKISKYLKDATVAIEDKNFYSEPGISLSGIARGAIYSIIGKQVQGGSTLTQQLVKQVFLSDESGLRGINGIPRKIKEAILSIEIERMYNKDQILTLYLNESPYGGRRNGAESAAQTYFGVSAKDLTLAEAALLAAIPQNPTFFNPYNIEGHDSLLSRQHTVLDYMAEQGKVTKAQAEEAKKVPILDLILPEANQYNNIKAPHFVQMVKNELIKELGAATVGNGGLTIKTTLDLRIQAKLEEAMNNMFASSVPTSAGFSNGAATVEDTKTGQIVALLGSRDFNYAGYGQDNAALSYLQPGSTVKALVYAELFQKKGVGLANYGSGSILKDENIDSLYGAPLFNADRKFKGPISIRSALATSRNIPAVEAMYISGVKPTLTMMHDMGATSYCTQGDQPQVGLAAAIGGCDVKQVDLVNAYASLARGGVYLPQTTILEVKNNSGDVLKKWAETAPVQVIDAQSAYIVSDILADDNARIPLDGYHALGMYIPGVKTATKTGTSDKGGNAKDIWMMSYSPVLTMGVWLGNSDATILKRGTSSIPGVIIDSVMSYAHKTIYAEAGLWKSGDWFTAPAGIQNVSGELYPSWWNKDQGKTDSTLTFDKVSKKKATALTPAGAKIDLPVSKMVDPITQKDVFTATDILYDASKDDDVHLAGDVMPSISSVVVTAVSHKNTITVTTVDGSSAYPINSVQISVGSEVCSDVASTVANTYTCEYTAKTGDIDLSVTATATDAKYYVSATVTAATKISFATTPTP